MKKTDKIKALLLMLLIITTISCGEDNSFSPQNPGANDQSGIYMGIVGFNQTLTSKDISILSSGTKSKFTGFVDRMSSAQGTMLYYAVDNAIATLTKSTLPNDIENVAIVTFTDGLDEGSFMMNSNYGSNEAYLSALNRKIKNTKVKGLPISAYSIGLKGNDVDDDAQFRANLINLASSSENAMEVSSMNEVNTKFQQIANKLYNENNVQTLNLTIPGQANGTKIRFTFDNVVDASQSQFYIEGTFSLSDRSLKNVTYRGMTSSSGSVITGVQDGIMVTFKFRNIKTTNSSYGSVPTTNLKQWKYITTTSRWQINSEFTPDGQSQTTIERKSAVIILVLDCSSSLGSKFSTMKTHAKSFIELMAKTNIGLGTTINKTHNGHEYVDLGLSVKWATCNVGATSPEGLGNEFRLGETTLADGSSNPTTLPLSADAANANWGGKWRMPTKAEMQELIDKCKWTSTKQNGRSGHKVTSKKNGNSIFLPNAKWVSYGDVSFYELRYWSSSLIDSEWAYYMEENKYGSVVWLVNGSRNSLKSVRAVFK